MAFVAWTYGTGRGGGGSVFLLGILAAYGGFKMIMRSRRTNDDARSPNILSGAPGCPSRPSWRYQHHGRLGSSQLVLLAEDTLHRLESKGVELLAGNRAEVALEILRQSHDGRIAVQQNNVDGLAQIARAIRDTWEFQMIARALPKQRDAELDGKLALMMRSSGRSEQTARDHQFELLVGAMFAMAGIPARPADPDLRFMLLK